MERLGFHALLYLRVGAGGRSASLNSNSYLSWGSCTEIRTGISPFLNRCPNRWAAESCSLSLPLFDLRNPDTFFFELAQHQKVKWGSLPPRLAYSLIVRPQGEMNHLYSGWEQGMPKHFMLGCVVHVGLYLWIEVSFLGDWLSTTLTNPDWDKCTNSPALKKQIKVTL